MSRIELSMEEINKMLYRYDKMHVSLNGVNEITDDIIRKYKLQGFISSNHLLNDNEVKTSIDALMYLGLVDAKGAKLQFAKPESELKTVEERELALRKIYEFVNVEEKLRNIAYHPSIIGTISRIFGEEPRLIQDMALLKPPHGGGEKPWHQDMAYGNLTYTKAVIGVWIALDEATIDNGCMHVIPKSHQEGATPHYAVRDWQLCDSQVPVERDVLVPLKPGGVLFFHGMLYHGTPSNLSTMRRRALQFHYAPASAERVNPKEYKRMFTNELTGAEC
ncbi:phytanoyl-CoA dioxygenase family protein [Paenibacillus sp. GCM10027629]|uniref:phytanoyl-CoA dioxygenase family protein n=1 Tax=Paenibacillus sp. GCM10027629 TaxID=3273414 RepID=UPI00362BFD3E